MLTSSQLGLALVAYQNIDWFEKSAAIAGIPTIAEAVEQALRAAPSIPKQRQKLYPYATRHGDAGFRRSKKVIREKSPQGYTPLTPRSKIDVSADPKNIKDVIARALANSKKDPLRSNPKNHFRNMLEEFQQWESKNKGFKLKPISQVSKTTRTPTVRAVPAAKQAPSKPLQVVPSPTPKKPMPVTTIAQPAAFSYGQSQSVTPTLSPTTATTQNVPSKNRYIIPAAVLGLWSGLNSPEPAALDMERMANTGYMPPYLR
jgi:hypothetical protein